MDTTESHEKTIAKLEDRIAEIHAQSLKQIQELATRDPATLSRMICEGVLAEPGTDIPFAISGDENRSEVEHDLALRYRESWLYLADLVLRTLNNLIHDDESGDFIRISDWLEFNYGDDGRNVCPFERYNKPYWLDICSEFFSVASDHYSSTVFLATNTIAEGVPAFEEDAMSGEFKRVSLNDEQYVFVRVLGERGEHITYRKPPDWSKRFYFKREHLKLHEMIFNFAHNPSTEEIAARKAALQNLIGDKPSNDQPSGHRSTKSRLRQLLDTVVDRYYGRAFDLEDQDTWPSQESIVGWLMENHGLSKREAEAIDIVTRPDKLRRK